MDEDLLEDVEELRIYYHEFGLDRLKTEIARESESSDEEQFFIALLDRQGKIVFSSDLSSWPHIDTEQNTSSASEFEVLQTIQFPAKEFSTHTVFANLGADLFFYIGESMEEKAEIQQILLSVISILILIIVPLIGVLGRFIARHRLRGIESVIQTAESVDDIDIHQRVEVAPECDEVQRLMVTFNTMLDRIQLLITEMREMTDNVSHDLRSPLARIRALAEAALASPGTSESHQNAAFKTIEESDRLLQMINTSLDISELEVGLRYMAKTQMNISDLVDDACELFEPLADDKLIKIQRKIMGRCTLLGNIQALQRMLANLLDNAIKYTPTGGKIEVQLKCSDTELEIAVVDSGIGIDISEHSKVFERFYRSDQSRQQQGCGLGLSYARAVAKAHDGKISLNSALGKGSCFTISLPKP